MSEEQHVQREELELYAVGALPEEEGAALKEHVARCDGCARKLAEAHGVAALVGFAAKQERPAGTIKAELMARVRASREKEVAYEWPLQKESSDLRQTREDREAEGRMAWWNWVVVVAALALALVSLGLSWQNWKLTAQLAKEQKAARALAENQEEMEKVVRVLAAPDTVTVKLAGMGDVVGAKGEVKYNGRMGTLVYSAELPELPVGKSYQMWVVPVKGAPMKGGVLGAGGSAWGDLQTAAVPAEIEAKEFMVTIESGGAVSQPTGPKVLAGTN